MKKLLFSGYCIVLFLCCNAPAVYAGQTVYSENLSIDDVRAAIQSGSFGGIRVQSGIVDIADIERTSIRIIDVHQEGNAAIVYCNFTHRQGEDYFGYVPLLRLKNSTIWINRDNGIILEK